MKQGKLRMLTSCLLVLAMLFASLSFAYAEELGSITITSTSTKKTITLTWNAVNGADYYKVTKPDGKTSKVTDTKFKQSKLASNTTYAYAVSAYDAEGKQIASGKASAKTKGVGDAENMVANPGYKSITVTFKKVKNASYYEIQRWNPKKNKWVNTKKLTAKKYTDKVDDNYIAYKDTKGMEPNKNVKYRVRAARKQNGTLYHSQKWTEAKGKPVRQMYQNIKVGGKWHVANGYSGGKYYTKDGGVYSVTRVSAATCDYSKKKNYSKRSAENFANELMKAGKFSRRGKKRLIWISSYTQHIYVFKWKNKSWKLEKDWECSTGKAGSATPMGFNKYIGHKHYERHGINYWNCFSSCNAMHGKHSYWVIDGTPQSGGCVRNENKDAKWIRDNCAVGTTVISW